MTSRGVVWIVPGSTPEESLDGMGEESLVREAVVVAHGGWRERGGGRTRWSMTGLLTRSVCENQAGPGPVDPRSEVLRRECSSTSSIVLGQK